MKVMDDLISRQAAIDALNGLNKIVNLPSAQPKKGRWLNHLGLPLSDFCSVCANDSPFNKHWDYCPNCGAKMEEEE